MVFSILIITRLKKFSLHKKVVCRVHRKIFSVKKDLDGKLTYLVSTQVEGSLNVATLLLTGRATPYLHNGVQYVGDEDHYVSYSIINRRLVHCYRHVGPMWYLKSLLWYSHTTSDSRQINWLYEWC